MKTDGVLLGGLELHVSIHKDWKEGENCPKFGLFFFFSDVN